MKMKENESVDIEKVLIYFPKKFEFVVVPIEEFRDTILMYIDELIGSLITHDSRMSRYDNPLDNSLKSQLHVTRGSGKRRSSSRGRWGHFFGLRDNKNDSESEEKTQQNPPSLSGVEKDLRIKEIKGMINLRYNAIVINLDIMLTSVGRSKQMLESSLLT